MGEGGTATVVMTTVAAFLAIVSLATASLGLAYSARAKAQSAADAAALAAAVATYPGTGRTWPTGEAVRAAEANGAALVSCRCATDATLKVRAVVVETSVPVDLPVFGVLEVRALSRAEFDPRRWLGR